MGCISSKTDINDLHPNIFQVMNVDDQGNKLNPGQLEITETDLVLYQRKKAPLKWPLRCLRRYGFDAELFSFEAGRRCTAGSGIYAFHCRRAERLFNLVQTHMQVRNIPADDSWLQRDASSIMGSSVPARMNVGNDTNYLEPSFVRPALRGGASGSTRFSSGSGSGSVPTRLSSVGSSSNGPVSPQETTSPSPPLLVPSISPPAPTISPCSTEVTTKSAVDTAVSESSSLSLDQRSSLKHSLSVSDSIPECTAPLFHVDSRDTVVPASPSYINVELSGENGLRSPTFSQNGDSNYTCLELGEPRQSPLYMNIFPGIENGSLCTAGQLPASYSVAKPQEWDVGHHCYENLSPGEMEVTRSQMLKRLPSVPSSLLHQGPLTPPVSLHREVNYAVLDLDGGKPEGSTNSENPEGSSTIPPESPKKASAGYATIDFDKTVALLHSVQPSVDNDSEGSRKTRHNSTINDVLPPHTRHSSSD